MDWRESMLRGRSEDELRGREDIGIVIDVCCEVWFLGGVFVCFCCLLLCVSPHLAAGIS